MPFYLFSLIETHPDYALTINLVEKMLDKTDPIMWRELCYFCFHNNYEKTFYCIHKMCNISLDMNTIHSLYDCSAQVCVKVNRDTYSFDIKPNKKKGDGIFEKRK